MSAAALTSAVVDPAVRTAINEVRAVYGAAAMTDAEWEKSKLVFIGLVGAMISSPSVSMIGSIINQLAALVPENSRTDDFQTLVELYGG